MGTYDSFFECICFFFFIDVLDFKDVPFHILVSIALKDGLKEEIEHITCAK